MAVSIEQFAAVLTGADYLAETEGRAVVLCAKYKPKTGERAGENEERIFIPLGEAWEAASSGLWSFRCMRLDTLTGEWEFKTYNVGRFQTLPTEIETVEV
jgi:hypothetical protein